MQFPLLVGSLCPSSNAALKSAGNLTNEQRCEWRGCSYCSTHPVPATSPPSCSGAPLSTNTFPYLAAPKVRRKGTAPRRTKETSCSRVVFSILQTYPCSFINPDCAANPLRTHNSCDILNLTACKPLQAMKNITAQVFSRPKTRLNRFYIASHQLKHEMCSHLQPGSI